ncbi:hypothetical protein [uncultured Clostridium sp.]|uniref:hypothetical protein n=1 Tax=uncultured Clostridium sp. TaxID=59620 RepID=UPI003216D7B0
MKIKIYILVVTLNGGIKLECDELIKHITKKIIAQKLIIQDRCLMVGIDGQGCSGKSTLSQNIKNSLLESGIKAEVVSIDDFCNKRATRYSDELPCWKQQYHNNFDYMKFENDILKQARITGKIEFSDFVLDTLKDEYTKKLDVSLDSEGILIIEGIFIFKNEFKKYYDYSIMLVVETNEQLRRASERDIFKNDNLKVLLNKYNNRYIPAYRLYEKIDNPYSFVDLIIDNTNVDMPNIIK